VEICAACRHVRALHLARSGGCRLGGCRCGGFEADVVEQPSPEPGLDSPRRDVGADVVTLMVAAITFVLGFITGHFL
jgi:hypothetical protein